MTKKEELLNPSSCLSKAELDEVLFVLLGRDLAFPATVRFWVDKRIEFGLNQEGDVQTSHALVLADRVENELRIKQERHEQELLKDKIVSYSDFDPLTEHQVQIPSE